MSDCRFLQRVFCISTEVTYWQRCLVVTWLVPRETAAVSARSVYTIQPCALSCHFIQSPMHRVRASLAVTCHLYLGRNARDLSHATAVTQGRTDTGMSQCRKLTLEKTVLPPLLQRLEPATFRGRRSNHWTITAPEIYRFPNQTIKKRVRNPIALAKSWNSTSCALFPIHADSAVHTCEMSHHYICFPSSGNSVMGFVVSWRLHDASK